MDFMKDIEEIAGAVAAVEGVKKADPGAGFITEAAAALTGSKVAGGLGDKLEELLDHKKEEDQQG